MVMKRLYVRGIPYSATESELRTHFTQFGKVIAVQVVMDRETQRSKGFAFVEFETEEQAKLAMQKGDGIEFGGRRIMVSEARPKGERPPMGSGFRPPSSFGPRPPFGARPGGPGGPRTPQAAPPTGPGGAVRSGPPVGDRPRGPKPAWREAKERREREARINRRTREGDDEEKFKPDEELDF